MTKVKSYIIKNKFPKSSTDGWGAGYVLIPPDHPIMQKKISSYDFAEFKDTYTIVDEDHFTIWPFLDKSDIGSLIIGFDDWTEQASAIRGLYITRRTEQMRKYLQDMADEQEKLEFLETL